MIHISFDNSANRSCNDSIGRPCKSGCRGCADVIDSSKRKERIEKNLQSSRRVH